MTAQILGGLAQRAGFTAFAALLGRWVGPQVVNYVAATVTRPLILPLAAVGVGAAVANAVQQRLLASYPTVRQQLAALLNGAAFMASGFAVVTGVVYLVTWNNAGPLNRFIDGAVDLATRGPALTYAGLEAIAENAGQFN